MKRKDLSPYMLFFHMLRRGLERDTEGSILTVVRNDLRKGEAAAVSPPRVSSSCAIFKKEGKVCNSWRTR